MKSIPIRLLQAGCVAAVGLTLSSVALAQTPATVPPQAPATARRPPHAARWWCRAWCLMRPPARPSWPRCARSTDVSGWWTSWVWRPPARRPNWAENVKNLVTADLKSVQRGHLKISGNTVELVGETDSTATREKIAAHLSASLNPTYTVNNRLSVGEAPQARIDSVLDGKIVEFESSSAVLTPVGRQVLDELVTVLKRIGWKEGAGHRAHRRFGVAPVQRGAQPRSCGGGEDVPGGQWVASQRRYLTIGAWGRTSPWSANETPEGRAKNRRIEFKVLP